MEYHTTMQSRNGNRLVEDKKIESLYKHGRNRDSSYLEKFVEEELRLGELGKRKIGNQPIATQDDKALTARALRFLVSINKKEKRDSGRHSLCHAVDATRELDNAYIEYFDKQRNWPSTILNSRYILTELFHDAIEDNRLTKQAFFETFNQIIDSPAIENKEKYRHMLPATWTNIVMLTRHGTYEKLFNDIINKWNKEQLACKIPDRTVNMREMGILKTPSESFFNNITDPLISKPWIRSSFREIINTLSAYSHTGTEKYMELRHNQEIRRRLYSNAKILYEVFKSFIIIDATNAFMKLHLKDDFLITLKKRLITSPGASLHQLKQTEKHLLTYHCTGLKKGYSVKDIKDILLDENMSPLLIISDSYLKKLAKKRPDIFKGDLKDEKTIESACGFFKNDYEKRKTGTRFNVGDLIHLEPIYREYVLSKDINRITYPREKPRENPFDSLFYKWLIQIARGDEKIMDKLMKQYEEEWKLAEILIHKVWQYESNHDITQGWGKKKSMKIDDELVEKINENMPESYALRT